MTAQASAPKLTNTKIPKPRTHKIGWDDITELARGWDEIRKGDVMWGLQRIERALDEVEPRWRECL